MSTIADNIGLVSQRIRAAADAVQRDASSIHLLAVSKTKPAQAVRPGDTVTVSAHGRVRVLRVLALGERRGPATEAATLYEDVNP